MWERHKHIAAIEIERGESFALPNVFVQTGEVPAESEIDGCQRWQVAEVHKHQAPASREVEIGQCLEVIYTFGEFFQLGAAGEVKAS